MASRKPWAVRNASNNSSNIEKFASLEERKLWHDYSLTKDLASRNRLIELYIPLAEEEARNYVFNKSLLISRNEKDTILSDATYGLVESVLSFDPTKGVNPRVWARFRIRGSIIDGLRQRSCFPRLVMQYRSKLKPLFDAMAQVLGRQPTTDEFCAKYGEDHRAIISDHLFSAKVHSGTLQSDNQDSEYSYSEFTVSTSSHRNGESRTAAHVQSKIELLGAISKILKSANQRMIIQLYYFSGRNSKQIAEVLGLSQSSVILKKTQAIETLKQHKNVLKQFLHHAGSR